MLFNYNHVFIVSCCITIRYLCSGMSDENPNGSHLMGVWVYHRALVDLSMPILNKCIVDPISIIVNHVNRPTMNHIYSKSLAMKIMGLPCSSPAWPLLNHYWTQQKGAEAAVRKSPSREVALMPCICGALFGIHDDVGDCLDVASWFLEWIRSLKH